MIIKILAARFELAKHTQQNLSLSPLTTREHQHIYIPNEYIYYPGDRNRTDDRSIYENLYSRSLYQLSYSRLKKYYYVLSLTTLSSPHTHTFPTTLAHYPCPLPFPTHLSHYPCRPTPGPRRVRTVDLTINSRSLYQLSYGTQTKTTKKGFLTGS